MRKKTALFFLLFPAISGAGNWVEETNLAADGLKGLRHGEIIRLPAAQKNFVAVLDQARSQTTEGGVILLPDAGQSAATQIVAGPLRDYLPSHGWTTLSIQLPVLAAEARPAEYWRLLPEASRRIDAAVNWWKQKGVDNIVLCGHGWGSLVAATYMANRSDDTVRALVLVSLGWPQERARMMKETLSKITVPVLDIWASQDRGEVLGTRLERQLIFKGKTSYRQLLISASGHDYRARQIFLAKRVLGWLRRTAPGFTMVNSD